MFERHQQKPVLTPEAEVAVRPEKFAAVYKGSLCLEWSMKVLVDPALSLDLQVMTMARDV